MCPPPPPLHLQPWATNLGQVPAPWALPKPWLPPGGLQGFGPGCKDTTLRCHGVPLRCSPSPTSCSCRGPRCRMLRALKDTGPVPTQRLWTLHRSPFLAIKTVLAPAAPGPCAAWPLGAVTAAARGDAQPVLEAGRSCVCQDETPTATPGQHPG